MMIAGQQLRASRAGNPENAIALQQLITQQQAALMQRLTGKLATPVVAPTAIAPPAAAPAATAHTALTAEVEGPPAAGEAEEGQAMEEPAAPRTTATSIAVGNVVRLEGMVERDELVDDEEYKEMLEDTRVEVAKYGALKQVKFQQSGVRQLLSSPLNIASQHRGSLAVASNHHSISSH